MADPFVSEIRIFPFNFPPTGWAFCDGQLMPISQNTALFSLLGTYYGGDGKSTFALPDLGARVPVNQGQGSGLSDYYLGQAGGDETVTLQQAEMPAHNHALNVVTDTATERQPQNQLFATGDGVNIYDTQTPTAQLAATAVGTSGNNQPHNNLQPYLVLNFCLAMQGVFPPRG
jgi:microcystin-dependent protein